MFDLLSPVVPPLSFDALRVVFLPPEAGDATFSEPLTREVDPASWLENLRMAGEDVEDEPLFDDDDDEFDDDEDDDFLDDDDEYFDDDDELFGDDDEEFEDEEADD